MINQNLVTNLNTPVYLCDEEKLIQNAIIFNNIQKRTDCKIILALKAFSMHSTFSVLKPHLSGVTASSLNEARLGHDEFQKEVHTYSPAYKENEINELANYSDHITFNSQSQLKRYKHTKLNVGSPPYLF